MPDTYASARKGKSTASGLAKKSAKPKAKGKSKTSAKPRPSTSEKASDKASKQQAMAKARSLAPELVANIGSTPHTKFRGNHDIFGRMVEDHHRLL